MTNYARFKINGTASPVGGVEVLNAAAATFALEAPTSEVWKVTYSTADATDVNAPLASKDAPELTLDNGAGSTGTSVTASTPSANVTTTWPGSGFHSYIVRCTVNNGVNSDGSVNSDYVFERMCSISTTEGVRKIVATEGTQYSARGWADAQNDMVDAFPSVGVTAPYIWALYEVVGGAGPAAAIAVGQAVCMGLADGLVVLASTANLAECMIPLGIKIGANVGALIPVAIAGVVPTSITGLGAGTAGEDVRVNATGETAVRGWIIGHNYILGTANSVGALQLAQGYYQIVA